MMSDAVEGNGAGAPESLGPHQKEFMEACVECFQKGINGVLEFGENKGRRGLLLCSALSFLQNVQGGPVKRVLFLCGSGEELSNTIDEFKRSVYASMRMVVVNDLNNLEALLEHLKSLHDDSEEMEPERCIILSTQELFFDVILSFPSPEYDLKGTLVLIDDAFQIEEKCQSFSSLSWCKLDQLTKLLQGFKDAERIIAKLDGLKKVFRSISLNLGAWYDPVFKGMEISNVLQQCNAELNDSDIQYLKAQGVSCEEVLHFMSTTKRFNCHVMSESNHMTSELIKQNLPAFNMYVTNKFKKQENHTESCQDSCKTLNFLCLDPSILFKMMTKKSPHSIILSSAIISPQTMLKTELGLLDAREFTGKCSVKDFQVFVRTVQCGPDGQFLEMRSGRDCFNLGYVTSMGKTILEVAKAMPAGMGMTIYFNSTAIFRQFKEKWLEKKPPQQSFWELIGQEKEIISSASHNDLKQFNTNIGQQKGSCIFATLEDEELKELVNSSMDCHRVVMMIGEPFPLQLDPNPKVTRKMVYNGERLASGQGGLTNHKYNIWENIKPIRKVLDNIIHTKHDYGVILLCDGAFQHAEELPPWLRGQSRPEMRFSTMVNELKEFLDNIERRTKWIVATAENPAQSNIQFGNVKAWEVEKVKVELNKLKKDNSHRELYRQRLKDSINTKRNEKEGLVKKLEELNVKITENLRHAAIKAEGGCSQLSPMKGPSQLSPMKGPSQLSPMKGPSQLSPMKGPSQLSPMKGPSQLSPMRGPSMPSPGKRQSMPSPGKCPSLSIPIKRSSLPSPGKEPSPRKRPYPENI